MKKGALYLFNRDLRITNHPALYAASEEFDTLLPVYIFDEGLWDEGPQMSKRMSPLRFRFIMESLQDLRSSLQKNNSQLLVLKGNPVLLLMQLREQMNLNTLCVQYEPDLLFQRLLHELSLLGLNIKQYRGDTLFSESLFKKGSLPLIFTQYKLHYFKHGSFRDPVATVSIAPAPYIDEQAMNNLLKTAHHFEDYSPKSAMPFRGGTASAMRRILNYISYEGGLFSYKETRNGMLGIAYSSKLSAWLSLGCIAVSSLVFWVRDMEAIYGANASTAAFLDELIWREFFRDQAEEHGHKLYLKEGMQSKPIGGTRNRVVLERWKQGETGHDFVDANMKELRLTGFMSNRGRQNVASYLIHNLNLDWRLGAAWFEERLLDYDPYSNYGNWQYIAGVGNSRNPRIFSIEKQAERYDPEGAYTAFWLR